MKSGSYIDEKLIRLREFYQSKTRSYDLLTDELFIEGKRVRFSPVLLFDGKVSAMIPESFSEMPEMIAKIRYISSSRPPVILTNTRYDENFAFHLLKQEEAAGKVQPDLLIKQMQDSVLRHAPETVLYDEGEVPLEVLEGRWFEYKNFTLDDETYNIQFLISSDSYLLVGSFNCRMVFFDEWKNPVLESLKYITIGGKGRETDESR